MFVKISRVYNLFGELIKSEEPEDVKTIECDRIELYKRYLVLVDSEGNAIDKVKLDFVNYAYDFVGGAK